MSYPTLTPRAADNVAATIGGPVDDEHVRKNHVVMAEGPRFDEAAVEAAAQRARVEWYEEVAAREECGLKSDLYLLEAFMASRIHRALRDLPVDMLEDVGFWRYLGLFPYRWYMQEREGGPSKIALLPQDYGGNLTDKTTGNVRPASPVYQLILRTYLWGKVAFDKLEEEPYGRATLVNRMGGAVTDVWHSHIVRIQLGQLGRLPHAFLDSICDEPKANTTNPARSIEKRLTRMKHTVLFDVYDLTEARAIVDHEKSVVLKAGNQ